VRAAASAILVAGLLASGCGGSSDPTATSSPTPSATPDAKRRPAVVDAIDDLSEFSCAPGEDGAWRASGVLTNATDRVASYAVTVVVAGAEAAAARGKQRTLPVSPREPTPFAIRDIPVSPGADPTCSVRVVRHR
jgi:hypothetical protein